MAGKGIPTRVCFNKVFSDMNKLLKKKNKVIDAYFSFEMPESYIPFFNVYSDEKILHVESERQKIMESILNVIAKKEKYQPKDPIGWFFFSQIIYPVVTFFYQKLRFPNMERAFYADSKCNGCGICEKICLAGKIRMIDNKPQWQEDIKCTYCFACLHFCPVESIQIQKRNTMIKGRYHHPLITAKDIIKQKECIT